MARKHVPNLEEHQKATAGSLESREQKETAPAVTETVSMSNPLLAEQKEQNICEFTKHWSL